MTGEAELVKLERFSIRFGRNPNATVDAADFAIRKGEIVALVAESGSGKSLVAHSLAGILTPAARLEAATFRIAGIDLRDPKAAGWRDLRGREIGIVFQNPRAALNPVRRVGRQIADESTGSPPTGPPGSSPCSSRPATGWSASSCLRPTRMQTDLKSPVRRRSHP